MRRIPAFLVLLTLCSCFHHREASGQLPVSSTINDEQKTLISGALKSFPEKTQFAVAVISNGKIQFFGALNQNDSMIIIVNHDRVFEIGSISKVFTSTLLAESVLAGKINLDEPIDKALGSPLKDNAKMSFKQLANHTSGLPRLATNMNMLTVDPANPYRDYDEAKLRVYLQNELKQAQEPGTKSEYSNLGVGLLGFLVSQVENRSYEDLLQERISKRLDMNATTTDRSKIQNSLVTGLNPAGEEVSNWDLNVLVGAGGILSSVEDLSKFALAQSDDANEAMKLTRMETFRITDSFGIGLGWHIARNNGQEYFNHNGGTGGYRSSMTINPRQKNGVIILSNVSAFHPQSGKIDLLCRELLITLE